MTCQRPAKYRRLFFLLQKPCRYLFHEAAGPGIPRFPVRHTLSCHGQSQFSPGPSNSHIAEPALLLNRILVVRHNRHVCWGTGRPPDRLNIHREIQVPLRCEGSSTRYGSPIHPYCPRRPPGATSSRKPSRVGFSSIFTVADRFVNQLLDILKTCFRLNLALRLDFLLVSGILQHFFDQLL